MHYNEQDVRCFHSEINEFVGQFYIGFQPSGLDHEFKRHELGQLLIETHETVPVAKIFDAENQIVGIIIGEMISITERRIIDKLCIKSDITCDVFWQDVENILHNTHGKYIIIIYKDAIGRVYLDADGIVSLVYRPDKNVAGSTSGILLDQREYRAQFRHELFNRLNVLGEGWFPSGLTAHTGVRRLLCNHYLDLASFKAVRHWPSTDFVEVRDTNASAEEVVARTAAAIEILLNAGRLASSLTGGNETRFVLAAARPFAKDIAFFTVDGPMSKRDVTIAQKLGRRFGLSHRVLPCRVATAEQQANWLFRASHSVGGSNMIYHPSVWPLAEFADRSIGGLGGEIGRAFFWRPSDNATMQLSARDIVARFGMPIASEVVEATEEWAAGVAEFNPLTRLDLAYLELRMSAWSFAQSYTQPIRFRPLHPMISRRIYEIMLSQSPTAKRANTLMRDGLKQAWPELLEIPINKYGDFRDFAFLIQRAASFERIRKKLIKRFG